MPLFPLYGHSHALTTTTSARAAAIALAVATCALISAANAADAPPAPSAAATAPEQPLHVLPVEETLVANLDKPDQPSLLRAHGDLMSQAINYCTAMSSVQWQCSVLGLQIDAPTSDANGHIQVTGHLKVVVAQKPQSGPVLSPKKDK